MNTYFALKSSSFYLTTLTTLTVVSYALSCPTSGSPESFDLLAAPSDIRHHLTILTPADNSKPCLFSRPPIGYRVNRGGPAIHFAGSVRMAVWMKVKGKQLGYFGIGIDAMNPTFLILKIEMVRVSFRR